MDDHPPAQIDWHTRLPSNTGTQWEGQDEAQKFQLMCAHARWKKSAPDYTKNGNNKAAAEEPWQQSKFSPTRTKATGIAQKNVQCREPPLLRRTRPSNTIRLLANVDPTQIMAMRRVFVYFPSINCLWDFVANCNRVPEFRATRTIVSDIRSFVSILDKSILLILALILASKWSSNRMTTKISVQVSRPS
jgi:hypothetical protein